MKTRHSILAIILLILCVWAITQRKTDGISLPQIEQPLEGNAETHPAGQRQFEPKLAEITSSKRQRVDSP